MKKNHDKSNAGDDERLALPMPIRTLSRLRLFQLSVGQHFVCLDEIGEEDAEEMDQMQAALLSMLRTGIADTSAQLNT